MSSSKKENQVTYDNPAFIHDDLEDPKNNDLLPIDHDEEAAERTNWSNPLEFLLSCVSMSVGIGNFYRFPFVAYENGGGAFLIPYLIILFLIGKPIYFLELAIGQFCSKAQVGVWDVLPLFRGVGIAATLASFCVVTYYVSVMALTVFYFFGSFTATLPWTQCDEKWAYNCSDLGNVSIAQVYFEREVLNKRENIDSGIGSPEWRLSLCYLLSWLCVFLSIIKGVTSSGKVAYFTAIYPYIVIATLLIVGSMKEGAGDGMIYFLEPQWSKLTEVKVWYSAISQCFFSLSIGFGPIIMYASYGNFRHNVYRDAMIVSLIDTATSFLAGLTVFAILGNLAHETGVDISHVAKSGPGLVFISYADAIGKFEHVPQVVKQYESIFFESLSFTYFFAALFCPLLFDALCPRIGSAVSWQLTVISAVLDAFPKFSKLCVSIALCAAGFLLGLIFVTPGGQQLLTLVDEYSGNFTIYILTTLEVIGFIWIYGLGNIENDIEFMMGLKISYYWKACWAFFVPVGLLVILGYSLITYKEISFEGKPYPKVAIACGWSLAAISIAIVPITAIKELYSLEGSLLERLKQSIRPNVHWGPVDKEEKKNWEKFNSMKRGEIVADF